MDLHWTSTRTALVLNSFTWSIKHSYIPECSLFTDGKLNIVPVEFSNTPLRFHVISSATTRGSASTWQVSASVVFSKGATLEAAIDGSSISGRDIMEGIITSEIWLFAW